MAAQHSYIRLKTPNFAQKNLQAFVYSCAKPIKRSKRPAAPAHIRPRRSHDLDTFER